MTDTSTSAREHTFAAAPATCPVDVAVDKPVGAGATCPLEEPTRSHGALDRLARRVLLLKDAEPRALMDLQGSLVISAVRCIISYVLIPLLLPVVAWAGVVATPLALALAVVAIGMSTRSLRRVWQANWTHRWLYTGFIAVVIGLLTVSIIVDVNHLLG